MSSATGDQGGTRRVLEALAIAAVVLVLDQLTKTWAVRTLSDGHTVDLVGSLQFNLAFNTGASFSLGSGLGPVFGVVVLVVIVLLLRYVREAQGWITLLGVGLVVGGAVGNLVDRVFRAGVGDDRGFLGGAVVDFIDPQWWPIFNVADMGVVIGALVLIVGTWLHEDDDSAAEAAARD